jgi:hypothetical protein
LPTVPVRQSRFDGGEATRQLWGRTDHPRYGISAKRILNFIPGPHGAADNRTGTRWIASTKNNGVAILRRFVVGTQSYILEIGASYIRFYSGGAQVLNAGPPLELSTAAAGITDALALPYLKFAQRGDTLTIAYAQQAGASPVFTLELKRTSHLVWSIAGIQYIPGGLTGFLGTPGYTSAPSHTALAIIPDATHVAKEWHWLVTRMMREDATRTVFETVGTEAPPALGLWSNLTTYNAGDVVYLGASLTPYTSLQGTNLNHNPSSSPTFWSLGLLLYNDEPRTLAFQSAAVAGFTLLGYIIYRGQTRDVTGYVGSADPTSNFFRDDGQLPDFTRQPPLVTSDPFFTGGRPACVAYYQSRRFLADTPSRPQRFVGSKPNDPSDFNTTRIAQDTDAVDFDIAGQDYDEIRALVPMRQLLAFTQGSIYSIAGFQGEGISPSSIDVRRHGGQSGASWVQPVTAGDAVLYVEDKGSSARELLYDPTYDAYRGSDISWFATHLFDNHTIVASAYQAYPNHTWWLVRDDGLLIGCTYFRSGDGVVLGWHQHPMDGAVEWVEAAPEGKEDGVYLIVRRIVNGATVRYVEKLASRIFPLNSAGGKDVRFAVFLDASIQADGRNVGAGTMSFVSDAGTYAGGEEGTITSVGTAFVTGDGSTDIGDQVVLDPNGGAYKLTILSVTDVGHARATLEQALPAAFQNVATTSWGFARDSFSGLSHLEAKGVMLLGDGDPQGPFTVTGGSITGISPPVVVAQIGLAYQMLLEPLDLAGGADAKGRQKVVKALAFELADSRGAWVGEDENNLYEWDDERTQVDGTGTIPLFSGRAKVRMTGGADTRGRAVLVQKDPLPCTVVAITREISMGGDL